MRSVLDGSVAVPPFCTVSSRGWHVTLLHMNSVVEAALIGVGGSVIVAVVAFVTTWPVTGRTLRADRERQILDKELATYELALSELMGMQIARLNGQFSLKKP